MGQKQKILVFALTILSFVSLIRTVYLLWDSYLPDFSVLYDSASSTLSHNNPYANKALYTQINYPPLAILMFFPFLLFKFTVASKIWLVISIISLFAAFFILYKLKPVNFLLLVVSFLGVVISFPFKFTLGMGQVNLVLLFSLSLLAFFKKRNDIFLSFSILLTSIFFILMSYFLVAINIKSPQNFMFSWYGKILLSHGFFGMLLLWGYLIYCMYGRHEK